MSILISRTELFSGLKSIDLEKFYIFYEMDGSITLYVSEEYEDQKENIYSQLATIDKQRTLIDTSETLYPLADIVIDDDDDDETTLRYEKRELFAKYHKQLNSWLFNDKSKKKIKLPPCVTFYSYKGGVGRSTALAITARLLARDGLKVAVIDLDLEAPGLNSLLLTKPKTSPFGVVDYLIHKPFLQNHITKQNFIERYIVREEVPRRNKRPGELWVMTAGGTTIKNKDEILENNRNPIFAMNQALDIGLDANYLHKLSFVDFDLYIRQKENVLESMLCDVANFTEADIILLDGRTGLSNVSGILLKRFSDLISLHVQDNPQNRDGIKILINEFGDKEDVRKMLWCHTKVPKDYDRSEEDLTSHIKKIVSNMCINDNKSSVIEESNIYLNHLPFLNLLEDVTAVRLQKLIDNDDIPYQYKTHARKIEEETGLDKKLFMSITGEEAMVIMADLIENMEKPSSKHPIYIPSRFLNPDLKVFVGFPGSGKKTFKQYMSESRNVTDIQVIGFEDYENMLQQKNPHQLLSSLTFLEWSFAEATQAACKWFLQSNVFLDWVKNNKQIQEILQEDDLLMMRNNPIYELPADVAEDLLEVVFGKRDITNRVPHLVWSDILRRLQYREGFVLPQDVIEAIQFIIQLKYKPSRNRSKANNTLIMSPLTPPMIRKIFVPIGYKKKQWIMQFDPKVLDLIIEYKMIRTTIPVHLGKTARFEIIEKLRSRIGERDFDKSMEKALKMGIFSFDERDFRGLVLAPVYNFVEK